MGGDTLIPAVSPLNLRLKSTPPAWAGTSQFVQFSRTGKLKSTPPAWAGTISSQVYFVNCSA